MAVVNRAFEAVEGACMTLWVPMADELLRGYVFRLLQANLLADAERLSTTSWVHGAQTGALRDAGLARGLADALGCSAEELVIDHALVPILNCTVMFNRYKQARPTFGDDSYIGRSMQCPVQLRLCRSCVERDRAQTFFHWHRLHQFHGVTWCHEHRRPLAAVERRHASRYGISTLLDEHAIDLTQDDVAEALASTVVHRYERVLRLILGQCRRPVHARFGAKVIRDRAWSRGLRVTPGATTRYLSDEAMTALPTAWLARHFPRSKAKRPSEHASWIDDAGWARSAPMPIASSALALALLWDDPDEAVGAFLHGSAAEEAQEEATGGRRISGRRAARG